MINSTKLPSVGLTLILSVLLSGCVHCISTSGLAPISPTQQFTIDNVKFHSAILPSGNAANISVEDYTLPTPDGKNEIKVGWSQTNTGGAEFARLEFPQAEFAEGVDSLVVSGFHYNSFGIEAFDRDGNNLGHVDATTQQRIGQDLSVPGNRIARIEVIGAEIGITKVCYKSN
jgi:hypothetical protein